MITPKQIKEVFKSLLALSCVVGAGSLSAIGDPQPDALMGPPEDALMGPPEHWANLREQSPDSLGFDALRRATEAENIEKSNQETAPPMDTTAADQKIQDQRDEDLQNAILKITNDKNLPELANAISPLPMDLNGELTAEIRKKIENIIEKVSPEENKQTINNQKTNLRGPDKYLSALLKSAMGGT